MPRISRRAVIAGTLAAPFVAPRLAVGQQATIRVGALATLEGPFSVPGQDSMRGVELALRERNNMAGGKRIELITASSNAEPDVAVRAARKLVEQDRVAIMIGPLSGSEGLAIKDYAKTQLGTTFVNGTSAAQDTTLRDPAPNFFRWTTDGAQWQAGLGAYAVQRKNYRRIVIVAEDYSFPYTLVLGFMLDFCRLGGRVLQKFWVPLGTRDYASVVAAIPEDQIDAIYVALGGSDAINFLTQYEQAGGRKPMIAGSITVDQTVLGTRGRRRDYLVGTPSAGPIADSWDNAGWRAWVQAYRTAFRDGLPSPSLFAHGYYVSTKAVLETLERVNGDLSDNHVRFRQTMASLELDTPTGKVKLDDNRNAIADIFLTEVTSGTDGALFNRVVEVIPQVNQTLGRPREEFLRLGPVSRDNPQCT